MFLLQLFITLILISGTAALTHAQTPIGKIVSIKGILDISRNKGETWEKAKTFQALFGGDLLRTADSSGAAILLVDESMIKLNGRTLILFKEVIRSPTGVTPTKREKTERSIYRIFQGELWLRNRGKRIRPIIETPTVSASIGGTELNLLVKEDGESILCLLEGLVEYGNEFGSLLVSSGETAIARHDSPPSKTVLLQPQDAVQWSFYYPRIISYRDYFFLSPDPQYLGKKMEEVREKILLFPEEAELKIQLAHLLHDLGRREEAKKEYEGVLTSSPGNPWGHTGLGWIYLEMNQPVQALAEFELVCPANIRSILGSSLSLYGQDRMAEAVETLKAGIARVGTERHLRTQLAFFHMLQGKAREAGEELREVLRIDPRFSLAYGILSTLLLTQNRTWEALENAGKAVQTNPFSPTAHLDLSLVTQGLFDLPKAMDHAREALRLDPENVRAMVQLSQLLFGADRIEEAERWMVKALAVHAEDSQVHTLAGFIALARRETDRAVRSFERAIELDSTQGEPHLGLGITLIRKRKVEQGLEEMVMATLLEPRRALFQSYLAKALYEARRFEEASAILEYAKSLDPHDPTPYLYASIIRSDLNQPGQGIQELNRSIALNDYRAVYRSRFLLDQDLSVKNANLAKSYGMLGLNAWARDKALWSLKNDPRQSGAHFFFGSAISELGESLQTVNSEFLKKRLLMPVNENSFNAFNDYTSFFDRPDIRATVEGVLGTGHLQDHSLVASGGTNQSAFQQYITYFDTEGVHPTNDDSRVLTSISILKYQLAMRQSLMASFFYYQRKEGDTSLDNDFWGRNDPDYRSRGKAIQWEIGYHYHVGPRSDLLVYGMGQHFKQVDNDRGTLDGSSRYSSKARLRLPSMTGQIVHQAGWGDHQFLYGGEYFTGAVGVDTGLSIPDLDLNIQQKEKVHRRFVSGFIQDSWKIIPNLFLEGALHYERTTYGDPAYSHEGYTFGQWNPRVGVIYKPFPPTTLRFAGASFLQTPHYDPRLSMGEIGGQLSPTKNVI